MVGWQQPLNGHDFEQALRVGDGHGSLVCFSPWRHKELDMTEQLNCTQHRRANQNRTQFPPKSISPIRELPLASYPYPSEGRQNENHNHRKLTKWITWIIALSNSKKLWAMPYRATQDGWVMVESSDKIWSTGEGNGKSLQYFSIENPMNSMKRQKDRTLKDELSRLVGVQYSTGEEGRNNSRKNEEMEPKQKQHPVVNVTSDRKSPKL